MRWRTLLVLGMGKGRGGDVELRAGRQREKGEEWSGWAAEMAGTLGRE
jgi:hypothetical protein